MIYEHVVLVLNNEETTRMKREVQTPDICIISTAVLESSVEWEAWSTVPAVAKSRVCQREGRQEDAIITTWFPTACVSTVRPVYSTLKAAIVYYGSNPHIKTTASTYHTRKAIRKVPSKHNIIGLIGKIVVIETTLDISTAGRSKKRCYALLTPVKYKVDVWYSSQRMLPGTAAGWKVAATRPAMVPCVALPPHTISLIIVHQTICILIT